MEAMDDLELAKRGFKKMKPIAEGSYGIVYLGEVIETGEIVAMKKMKRQSHDEAKEGIHFTTIREIKLLSEIRHENILGLLSVIVYKSDAEYNLWLISEYMTSNLQSKIKESQGPFSEPDIKMYMFMILKGLEFMHLNWYLHRDLSPSNVLISRTGQVKIADFGFTKLFGDDRPMTPEVVTLWYRSPELLFGSRYYGAAVDMWSFGCILVELLIRGPFLPGDQSDINQLSTIFAALGTPTEEDWPGVTKLPNYIEFDKRPIFPVEQMELFRGRDSEIIDLLGQCLKLCPLKRCNATQALHHKCLIDLNLKTEPDDMIKDELGDMEVEVKKETEPEDITIKQEEEEM
jgi:cyclin-dependent kinase 7